MDIDTQLSIDIKNIFLFLHISFLLLSSVSIVHSIIHPS